MARRPVCIDGLSAVDARRLCPGVHSVGVNHPAGNYPSCNYPAANHPATNHGGPDSTTQRPVTHSGRVL